MTAELERKIYLISRVSGGDYNMYDSFVIVAENRAEVRSIAASHAADEGGEVWLSHGLSAIEYLGRTNRNRGIVLGSFNAG